MDERLWGILVEGMQRIIPRALLATVPLTLLSFSLAMIIAVITALIQYANVPVLKHIARFYIWIIRGTPLLVQLYLVYFGLPDLGILLPAFPCAVLVLGLNEGAYAAETMRGALISVPSGQIEAGSCVGMSWVQVMQHIVLPQAFRVAFPALSNSIISLLKESSLASIITVTEIMMAAQRVAGRTYEHLALYLEAAIVYLFLCTLLTWLGRFAEKRMSKYKI